MRISTRRAHVRRGIPSQGAKSNYKISPDEPDDHAIGRSRGGLTTKIHALSDVQCSLVTMILGTGQGGDNPMLEPLIIAYRDQIGGSFRLLADKAYSHPSTRIALAARGVKVTIPERRDQIDRRTAKGSAGGRPPAFGADVYRGRNVVERCFARLKQWRAIATRYEKTARNYRAGIVLASILIWLK